MYRELVGFRLQVLNWNVDFAHKSLSNLMSIAVQPIYESNLKTNQKLYWKSKKSRLVHHDSNLLDFGSREIH